MPLIPALLRWLRTRRTGYVSYRSSHARALLSESGDGLFDVQLRGPIVAATIARTGASQRDLSSMQLRRLRPDATAVELLRGWAASGEHLDVDISAITVAGQLQTSTTRLLLQDAAGHRCDLQLPVD